MRLIPSSRRKVLGRKVWGREIKMKRKIEILPKNLMTQLLPRIFMTRSSTKLSLRRKKKFPSKINGLAQTLKISKCIHSLS
jgi:hypothetical protein